MNVRHCWYWTTGVAVAAMMALPLRGGCSTPPSFEADFLPEDGYVVGGGLMIEWEAPEDGTVYLIEKQTGKVIETRSLEAGGSYSFSIASGVQADEFEQVLGIEFSEARFLLYFEPAGD